MGKKVNQTELAEILGITDVTIWEWQKQGLPIETRGARGEANRYDTEAAIKWMIDREVRKVSTETQKDRLARLQGDMLEREIAEKDRVLVPATEVEPTWQMRVLAAAAFLSGQPSRLAGILEATHGIEAKRQIIKTEFAAFLNQLGVDGERMQLEVEELLAKVSESEAAAFLKRIAGNDVQPNTEGDHKPDVGEIRPPGEAPAV